MSKILDVYQAIAALAQDGRADEKQEVVAKLAGVSVRHMHRLMEGLRDLGVLEFFPLTDRRGHRQKTRFILKSLTDSQSHLGKIPNGLPESFRTGLTDSQSHLGNPNGLPESEHVLKHVMHDDVIKILKFLDFLSEPARSYCASKCTLSDAQKWREYFDFNTTHELWESLGVKLNPIGYIYRLIEAGHPPPALQIPMPGGSLDMPAFVSRGKTREEIEQELSAGDGATFGEDGVWR